MDRVTLLPVYTVKARRAHWKGLCYVTASTGKKGSICTGKGSSKSGSMDKVRLLGTGW